MFVSDLTLCLIPYRKTELLASQKTDINFPPGRPSQDTIQSLCQNRIFRPLYSVKCLPGVGYEWLARQAKTINRMEKGFKQCCKKKNGLNCAEQKVKQETYTHKYGLDLVLSDAFSCAFCFSGVKSSTGFAWIRRVTRPTSAVAWMMGQMIDLAVFSKLLQIHIIIWLPPLKGSHWTTSVILTRPSGRCKTFHISYEFGFLHSVLL